MFSFLNGNFTSLVRFSNHGAPTWLTLVLCYPYLLLDLILKLLFEKIELANVPDVDSRAKKKGFGVIDRKEMRRTENSKCPRSE